MKTSYIFFILFTIFIFNIGCKPSEDKVYKETVTYSFQEDSLSILEVLNTQVTAWNSGDIPTFMQGYWNDETLTFIGSRGVTNGWQQTLENYQKGYPDTDTMGKLSFDIKKLKSLGDEAAQVIGQFTLERQSDRPTGYFSLVFQKIEGSWKITSDMTASTPKE